MSKTHQITHRREAEKDEEFLGIWSKIFKTFFLIFSEMIFLLGLRDKDREYEPAQSQPREGH